MKRRRFVLLAALALALACLMPGVAAGAGVVKADAGDQFSLAVLSDGTLWCWGRNTQGQLGDGTIETHLAPRQVDLGTSWVDVSAGWRHSLGIKSDGSLWAWGFNKDGQLGIGHAENTYVPSHYHESPSLVATGTTWRQASAGHDHSVAIDATGSIWAWGANDKGQLGVGTTAPASSPVLVSPSPGSGLMWSRVWACDEITLALASDGVLWQWGNGVASPKPVAFSGASPDGVGATSDAWLTVAPTPTEPAAYVPDPLTESISHVSAVTSDSRLWSWSAGQSPSAYDLGYEYLDVAGAPGPFIGAANPVTAFITLNHSFQVAVNAYGSPTSVWPVDTDWLTQGVTRKLIGNDVDWARLSAGKDHFLITKTDGSLWSWGKNTYGQLGSATENDALGYGPTGAAVRTKLPSPVPNVVAMTQSDAEDRIVTRGFKVGRVTYVPTYAMPITRVISQTPASDSLLMPAESVNLVISAGPPVSVPDVVGMAQTAAETTLGGLGLGVGSVSKEYSSVVPSGAIVAQDPAPETLVAAGTKVALRVSRGPQPVTVPYTAGSNESTARSRLLTAGFTIGSVIAEYSTSQAAGNVIRTDPAAGILAFKGSSVNIYLSAGKPAASVSNPISTSSMRSTRYYTVYGYLKPRHSAGSYPVRIYKWRYSSGKWRSYGYVTAKASDYSSYTKFSARMKLGTKGRWRLQACAPADAAHKTSWSSGYKYVSVR